MQDNFSEIAEMASHRPLGIGYRLAGVGRLYATAVPYPTSYLILESTPGKWVIDKLHDPTWIVFNSMTVYDDHPLARAP